MLLFMFFLKLCISSNPSSETLPQRIENNSVNSLTISEYREYSNKCYFLYLYLAKNHSVSCKDPIKKRILNVLNIFFHGIRNITQQDIEYMKIWNYPHFDFKNEKLCFCNFSRTEHEDFDKILRIFELLCASDIFMTELLDGISSGEKNIHKLFSIITNFFVNEQKNGNFSRNLMKLQKTILIEFLDCLWAEMELKQGILSVDCIQKALISFLKPNRQRTLKIEYFDETQSPIYTRTFGFCGTLIDISSIFDSRYCSEMSSDIIFKYLKYDRSSQLWQSENRHEMYGETYRIVSLAFEFEKTDESTTSWKLYSYNMDKRRFYDCENVPIKPIDETIYKENNAKILICFERITLPEASSLRERGWKFVRDWILFR